MLYYTWQWPVIKFTVARRNPVIPIRIFLRAKKVEFFFFANLKMSRICSFSSWPREFAALTNRKMPESDFCLRSALYITTLFCLWNAYEISLMWFCSQNFANVTVCPKKCYQFTLVQKKTTKKNNLRNQTNITQKNTSPLSCAREVQM